MYKLVITEHDIGFTLSIYISSVVTHIYKPCASDILIWTLKLWTCKKHIGRLPYIHKYFRSTCASNNLVSISNNAIIVQTSRIAFGIMLYK